MTTAATRSLIDIARPRIGDNRPPDFPTFAEQRQEKRKRDEETPGFFGGAAHALSSEGTIPWLMRGFEGRDFEYDPDFRMTEPLFDELTEGLPTSMFDAFEDAVSEPHARRIREQMLGVAESRRLLSQMGVTGAALRIGANILDPVAIGLDMAAAAIPGVNTAVYGAHLTRIQRMVRGGLLAAGVEGSIEALLTSQDPERGADDVIYAAAGAFILGGGINALLKPAEGAARSLRREIEAADARALGLDVTEKGQRYFGTDATVGDVPVAISRVGGFADGAPLSRGAIKDRVMQSIAGEGHQGEFVFHVSNNIEGVVATGLRRGGITGDAPIGERGFGDVVHVFRREDFPGAGVFDGADVGALDPNVYSPAKPIATFTLDELGIDAESLPIGARGQEVGIELEPPMDFTPEEIAAIAANEKQSREAIRRAYAQRESELPSFSISDVDAQRSINLTDHIEIDGESGFPDAIQGGAPKRVPDIMHNGVDLNFADTPVPEMETSLIGRLRYSMTGRLMRSKSGTARRLARMLADDALAGTRPGDIKNLSASEWIRHEFNVRMSRYYRAALHEFEQLVKAEGVPIHQKFERRVRFFEDVGRAVRREPGTFTTNPHVNAVADLMRREHAELLALAQRYQVKGFADIPTNATYLMRVHNRPAIDRLVTRYGSEQVERVLAGAIRSGSEDLSEEAANKIARGYLRVVMKLGDDTEINKARLFSTDNSEQLAQVLRENVDGITDSEVEDIIYALRPRETGDNAIPRAKRRLSLDETYRMQMDDGNTIAIEDLLENNAETLMNVYTRQILGASAIRQIQRDMSTGADDVIESWEAIVNRLRRDGASERDISRLETLYKSVSGHRLGDDTKTADVLRILRGFQYMRVGNQFGFAQIAELGNEVSNAGFKATLQQMPILPQIFAKARDGKLADEFLREVEAMFGTGTDFLRHQALHRLDENDAMIEFSGGRSLTWDRVEQTIKRGQRFTSAMSGMAPVNTFLQRSTVAAGIQKWMNHALSGRKMSVRRLAAMGLEPEMAERIMAQMRTHVKTEAGLFGRRVRRMNLDSWTDLDAASNFMSAIDIWSRRVIQENDIGNLAQWMTTDMGKSLIQFRTFVSVAWEKQFLFNVRMHDWETFTQFTGTMAFGALAYTAQQYANSIGRPDRREFLRERLSTDEIAKAAFQRAGWSSILPPIIDTGLYGIGADRQFSYGRTSQLSGDALMGNPTTDMIASLLNAPRSAVGPARDDYQFSQQDLRTMRNLLPFQNMVGITNMINALGKNLPERSKE